MNKRIRRLNVEVDSSVIEGLEYNTTSRTLGVRYKKGKFRGKTKYYEDVDHTVFFDIINAESVGRRVLSLFHVSSECV